MKELVYVKEMGVEKVGVTNSRLIAEEFGKEHKNVLRAIDDVIRSLPEDWVSNHFKQLEIIEENAIGKVSSYRLYEVSEEGHMLIIMGFTGAKAAQKKVLFLNAFKAMREVIRGMASSRLDVMGHIQAAFKQTSEDIAKLNGEVAEIKSKLNKIPDKPPANHYKFAFQILKENPKIKLNSADLGYELTKISFENGLAIKSVQSKNWKKLNQYSSEAIRILLKK